ncbi:MAG: PAS domain-containing protein, partial [Magnetococcus sp. WYHC-3]
MGRSTAGGFHQTLEQPGTGLGQRLACGHTVIADASDASRTGPQTAPGDLHHIDRRMMWIFGALTLGLLLGIALISTFYFDRVVRSERDRLAVTLSETLADSIQRVAFSGKHHVRLLLEDIVHRHSEIRYIAVVDFQGRILAHSDPGRNGLMLGRPVPIVSALPASQEQSLPLQVVSLPTPQGLLLELQMPYRGGYGDSVRGSILVGLDGESARLALVRWVGFISLLILALLALSMVIIRWSSTRLGAPVKRLAAQFQGILEHAPLLIAIHDGQGRLLATSRALGETLAAAGSDVTSSGMQSLFGPAHGTVRELSLALPGEHRDYLVLQFPLDGDASGGTTPTCTIATDITDRRRAEDGLVRERRLLRALLDSIPDLIFFKDTQGRYLGCNRAFERFANRPEAGLMGCHDQDLFGAEVGAFFQEQDRIMLASGQPRRNEEWITYPDGERVLLDTLKTPFWGPDNAVFGLIGISRDITSRKLAEEALQRSEQLFRQLAENISEVFWLNDWVGQRILYISPAIERIWGLTAAALYADPQMWFRAIVAADRQRVVDLFMTQAPGGGYDCEYHICRPDGDIRLIRDRGFPIRDEQGQVVRIAGIAEDVTEERRNREQLHHALQLAQRAGKAKADFLAMMSHEIRTPMNTILGMTELLGESPLNDIQQGLLHTQRQASEALLALIDDILNLSRIENDSAGDRRQKQVTYQPGELLAWVRDVIQPQARDKGLTILVTLDPSVPHYLLGEVQSLRQILLNLAGNAVKFTDQGEVVLGGRVEDAGRQLVYWVADTGPGIPEEARERIFEAFTQGDTYDTRRHGGSGLGLTIVRRLAEQIGGRM